MSEGSSGVGREMPRYKSHKEVWALQIDDPIKINPDGSITFGVTDIGYAPVTVTKDVVSRYMPGAGDFYVVYADGYKSFSPRKAFLEGYTPA
jgi:hypothetical protein